MKPQHYFISLLLLSLLLNSAIVGSFKIYQNAQNKPSRDVYQQITYIPQEHSPQQRIKGESATVSTSTVIGSGKQFTLFGYTSPGAVVRIEAIGLDLETIAKDNGYFAFEDEYAPFLSQEVCLTSTDTVGRLSAPVCLPPFPVNYNANIGPVILAPSISVDKGNLFIGQRAVLTGKTIPNEVVKFSFFKDEKKSLFTNLIQQLSPILPTAVQRRLITSHTNSEYRIVNIEKIGGTSSEGLPTGVFSEDWEKERVTESIIVKPLKLFRSVEAFSFPDLSTRSDKDGNFSIELPTSNQSFLRTFAQVEYNTAPSEKSLTLNIQVLPFWTIILTFISLFFNFLRNHFIALVFIIEIIVLLIFVHKHYFHPYRLAKTKALMIYKKPELLVISE
ncbi:MAG TPA: hypothetical protein VK338_01200 [Candidatus Nitrosocosmicus sp.]|nr:hypothetical protein [Candidatus Nitrosocosmicus sp.]